MSHEKLCGVWKRYKTENEKEAVMLLHPAYAMTSYKQQEAQITIEKTDAGYLETYTIGSYKATTTLSEDFSNIQIDLGYGKTIKLTRENFKNGGSEFTLDGIKRQHKREFKG